ncbi:MAG: phage tail protein [Chloroflexi bacterium]|nr:phage tail protein [Chloroflexota bacterium]
MPENSHNMIDSLVANEFALEIDGQRVNGIFRIVGFVSFKFVQGENRLAREPFKISKMVQRDGSNLINRWIHDTRAAAESGTRPRRTLTLLAIDNGKVTRRWTIQDAWISEIAYSEFNTASAEMVEEVLTIHYSHIDEEWPLSH